ncbi:MAG: hypothetical protein IRF16MM_04875 [Candidatus Midichloria mitochondrii]|nr:hypothetical protein [Candidatus Midichloria mitochondrii]
MAGNPCEAGDFNNDTQLPKYCFGVIEYIYTHNTTEPVITTTSHYDPSSSNQNFGAIISSVIGGVAANNIHSRKRGIYKYTY